MAIRAQKAKYNQNSQMNDEPEEEESKKVWFSEGIEENK